MATISSVTPSGVIFPYAGSTAPDGWLLCDGTAYSRTTYARLFNAIGTAYGNGNNSTTFNVPDFRYMFLRGKGPATSVTGSGSASSNQATFTSHGFTRSGIRVRRTSGSFSTTNLAANTTYYVIVVDANTLAFASSYANALAGTKVTIAGTNTAVIQQWEDADIGNRVGINGGNTGANLGSYQEDGFQSHNHSGSYPTQIAAGGGGFSGSGLTSNSGGTTSTSVVSDGGNQYGLNVASNNTRSMNIFVNYIIKI